MVKDYLIIFRCCTRRWKGNPDWQMRLQSVPQIGSTLDRLLVFPKIFNSCFGKMHNFDIVLLLALAKLKYNILLEKPMAVSIDECVEIYKAVVENNVILAVGHVLRYTDYTTVLMRILASNALGDIVNIQHLEPVGFWHFAHSVSFI